MPIDLKTDKLITLSEACRMLPKRPNPSTLWRWRSRGVQVGGKRIWLECVRVGRSWYTTRAAFVEFMQQQTAGTGPGTQCINTPSGRSAVSLDRLVEAGLVKPDD